MSHRKILGILLGVSLLGAIIGFGLNFPDKIKLCESPYGTYGDCTTKLNVNFLKSIGICSDRNYGYEPEPNYCLYRGDETIGQPVMIWSSLLFIIFFILIFLSKEIFKTWKKIAIVLIPVSIILIIITPIQCSAPLGLCFDKSRLTIFLSVIFSIISLIIIIYKSVRILLAKRKARR